MKQQCRHTPEIWSRSCNSVGSCVFGRIYPFDAVILRLNVCYTAAAAAATSWTNTRRFGNWANQQISTKLKRKHFGCVFMLILSIEIKRCTIQLMERFISIVQIYNMNACMYIIRTAKRMTQPDRVVQPSVLSKVLTIQYHSMAVTSIRTHTSSHHRFLLASNNRVVKKSGHTNNRIETAQRNHTNGPNTFFFHFIFVFFEIWLNYCHLMPIFFLCKFRIWNSRFFFRRVESFKFTCFPLLVFFLNFTFNDGKTDLQLVIESIDWNWR